MDNELSRLAANETSLLKGWLRRLADCANRSDHALTDHPMRLDRPQAQLGCERCRALNASMWGGLWASLWLSTEHGWA